MVKTAFQEEAVSCMRVLSGSAALELGTHPYICGRSDDWSGCPLLGRNGEVAAEFHDLVRADGRLTFPLGK